MSEYSKIVSYLGWNIHFDLGEIYPAPDNAGKSSKRNFLIYKYIVHKFQFLIAFTLLDHVSKYCMFLYHTKKINIACSKNHILSYISQYNLVLFIWDIFIPINMSGKYFSIVSGSWEKFFVHTKSREGGRPLKIGVSIIFTGV